jgi:hypothetical protein
MVFDRPPPAAAAAGRKLVALSVSQLLFSFATYMHDAYLPVYLQDVLGLSNTKVRHM